MSDKTEELKAEQPAAALPPIQINAQYIKDLSFEAPSTPGIFAKLQKEAPDVTINVDVNAHPIQDHMFEVQLHIRATCKSAKIPPSSLNWSTADCSPSTSPKSTCRRCC